MENQQQSEICVVEELIRGLSPRFRTPCDSWGAECGIEEVSIDLSGNYKSLVRKNCPSAEVTVDRFHVTKMIYEELKQARIDKKKRQKH
jgi:transposase